MTEIGANPSPDHNAFDWRAVCRTLMLSRAIDRVEVEQLVPERKMFYQFSAGGHDLAQAVLGARLRHKRDAITGYYRSRPLLLAIGAPLSQALVASVLRAGGYSDGRDIGHVFNHPNPDGPSALPMAGGVGAQFAPAVGWAQALVYRADMLGEEDARGAIAVAHGGDASCATNGFWTALTIATTQKLPLLLYIEDNGFGISTSSDHQTPGRNIAANLAAFKDLAIFDGDGTDPETIAALTERALAHVRAWTGPALLRLTVPRLAGHSAQDTQTYKSAALIAAERARDPYPKLKIFVAQRQLLDAAAWEAAQARADADVTAALEAALATAEPDPASITRYAFAETNGDGSKDRPILGGLSGVSFPAASDQPHPEGPRINMVRAIRAVLDRELEINPKLLLFGEDIGPKGGVHAVTMGLQEKFGATRVFDTSLNEEGIIGRAVGMALAGLVPVPEIQFRKYADPACEQIIDAGTVRWRTNNRFACPMTIRMPVGFFKCGDPWHSQCNEAQWTHAIGWKVAMPSNAEDAVGLLRTALRGDDPVIFLEHRAMLDAAWARRPYPGDDYLLPFGRAAVVRTGDDLTVVSWGAMVERCVLAAESVDASIEVIDLRTLIPWDRDRVLSSVRRTHRCLIVHEDNQTAGFGAEIAAVLAQEAFMDLDAPVERLTPPDIPPPHNPLLLEAALPRVDSIRACFHRLLEF